MEIRNLVTFVTVAEHGSFTKASSVLGYSQSTVSFQIKQLETELDCLLFERINHTIALTQRGKELLDYAQQIINLTEEFIENTANKKELKGHIHIVTPDSVCEDMIIANYQDFHRRYPDISLKFTTADTVDMFRMLDHNEADIMITLDNHVYKSDYIIAKEEHVDMNFVASSNSPFSKIKNLSIRDIINEPFILTEKGMGYRRIFDKELAKKSLEIIPALEIGRTDIITSQIAGSDMISYLPGFVTDKKVSTGELVYLDVTDIKTEICKQLIYHKNKWISNCMSAFIQYVKKAEFDKKI